MTLAARQSKESSPLRVEPATLRASVIMPTHDRRQLLEKALNCLSRQTVDMSAIEVVVVADGCSDGTLDMLRFSRWPFALRVLQQSQQGVAASRNAAAAAAQSLVLIFLDDDMMAASDFIERHLAAHEKGDADVVIGQLAPASLPGVPGWWRWLESQLKEQYCQMLQGQRRVDGLCLYSGNCSMRREVFQRIGGFNEKLAHSEDVELGMRLERSGVIFRFAPDATAEHWGYCSYERWREMAYRYGRWDAGLVFNREHPSALARLRDNYASRGRLRQRYLSAALKGGQRYPLTATALRLLGWTTGVLRLSLLERRFYAAIYDLTYWKGVVDELGGLRPIALSARRAA